MKILLTKPGFFFLNNCRKCHPISKIWVEAALVIAVAILCPFISLYLPSEEIKTFTSLTNVSSGGFDLPGFFPM
jgi:hypothetical protein